MCNSEKNKKIQKNDPECDAEILRRLKSLEAKTKEITLQMDRLEDEVEREISIKQSMPFLDQLTERVSQVESFIIERFPWYKPLIETSTDDSVKDNDK